MNKDSILREFQRVTQQGLDILFPPQCAGCKKGGTVLCSSCLAHFVPSMTPLCQRCGSPLSTMGICQQCQYRILGLSGLRAVSSYQEPLRSCIHALKYDGNTRVALPLGRLLAQAYRYYGLQADAIIPVPLHSQRQKQRGYNMPLSSQKFVLHKSMYRSTRQWSCATGLHLRRLVWQQVNAGKMLPALSAVHLNLQLAHSMDVEY